MRCLWVLTLAALAALAGTGAAFAEETCSLQRKVSLEMTFDEKGSPSIPVSMEGKPFRMMVDTGATETILSTSTVAALGVQDTEKATGGFLVGISGLAAVTAVKVKDFRIGNMILPEALYMVYLGTLPDSEAGLFGADFLYYFDVDFDFANARFNLFSPQHCPGKVVYWTTGTYGIVPFDLNDHHLSVDVMLDGKKVPAIIDTGASRTIMSLDEADYLFDIDRDAVVKNNYRHQFKALKFGEVAVNNITMLLIPDKKATMFQHSTAQLIIGMDVLRQLHLYVAYKEGNVYVTPATAH